MWTERSKELEVPQGEQDTAPRARHGGSDVQRATCRDHGTPSGRTQGSVGVCATRRALATLIASAAVCAASVGSNALAAVDSAPQIDKGTTTSGDTEAVLRGGVDPGGEDTSYHFEYGVTTAYGKSTPVVMLEGGSTFVPVAQQITGLAQNQIYHYRLVANNAFGETIGPDRTVTTGPALFENRKYELVTPPQKFGSDIMRDSGRTRIAADGNAIFFPARVGFGDVRGTGIATEFIAKRDPHLGWQTHAVTPFQQPQGLESIVRDGIDPRYMGEFSPKLDVGVFFSNRQLTVEPVHPGIPSLYLRRDLTTPGAGTYQLLTPTGSLAFAGPAAYAPWFAGASSDFTHILFSSVYALTPEVPSQPVECFDFTSPLFPCRDHLYEWIEGQGIRFVGTLPDAEGGGAAPGSIAGHGSTFSTYMPHVMSTDGSRVMFTVPSAAGERMGRLYMRENGSTTIRINASERSSPDPERPAMYWDASEDGSVVYFMTLEQLTDDDTDNLVDLYRWTYEPAPDGSHLALVSVDHQPADVPHHVESVVGISADGSYVYFTGFSQLVAGAPPRSAGGETLLFVWHEGTVDFVGAIARIFDLADPGGWSVSTFNKARVTPDGKHFLFTSRARTGLTGYDNGSAPDCPAQDESAGCDEVYIYSVGDEVGGGSLVCASCRPDGERARADASIMQAVNGATSSALPHVMSDDARIVFFTTGEALVPADENGLTKDVYAYDLQTGELDLLSSGRSSSHSYFVGTTGSGRDAFFLTRERLDTLDVDNSYDLYDARVGGGFPKVEPPSRCVAERCRGSVGPAPLSPFMGGSAVLDGASRTGGLAATLRVRSLTAEQLRRFVRGAPVILHVRVSHAGRIRASVRVRLRGRSRTVAKAGARAPRAGRVSLKLALARKTLGRLEGLETRRAVLVVQYRTTDARKKQALFHLRLAGNGA